MEIDFQTKYRPVCQLNCLLNIIVLLDIFDVTGMIWCVIFYLPVLVVLTRSKKKLILLCTSFKLLRITIKAFISISHFACYSEMIL